jgi:MGT family glycosyltransferase
MVAKRFLFVVPPLTGHVNPAVSVATELESRGHTTAWVAHPGKVRPLLPPDARLFALDDTVPDALVAAVSEKADSVRGLAALKFLWEDFLLPLAKASLDGVATAVARFQPDVMVVDQQALAGALVARKQGIAWATSCTTSAGVTAPLSGLPKVQQWLDGQLELLQRRAGLEPVANPDLSTALTLVFSSRLLVGDAPGRFPESMQFVGPATAGRPTGADAFDWDLLADCPRILVSLGTVNMDRGERFYRAVMDAVRGRDVQVIMVAPERLRDGAPANVHIYSHVPQVALLPHMNVVVSHGGHNTVCEALQNGLPLVVAPIKDDQPVVAQQVVDAGAGLRVRFGRVNAVSLWEALEQVLSNSEYKRAAQRIGDSFTDAGGASQAADLLEQLP